MRKLEKGIIINEYGQINIRNKDISSSFGKVEYNEICQPSSTPITIIINTEDIVKISESIEIVNIPNLFVNNALNVDIQRFDEFNKKLTDKIIIPTKSAINLVFNDNFNTQELYILIEFLFKIKNIEMIRLVPYSLYVFQGLCLSDGVYVDCKRKTISFIFDFVQFARISLNDENVKYAKFLSGIDYTQEYKDNISVFLCNLCDKVVDDNLHLQNTHFVSNKCVCGKSTSHDDHFNYKPSSIEDKLRILLHPAGDKQKKLLSTVIYSNSEEIKIPLNLTKDTVKIFLDDNKDSIKEYSPLKLLKNSNTLTTSIQDQENNNTEEENNEVRTINIYEIYAVSSYILNNGNLFNELFISKKEWDLYGVRIIKEKTLFV